MYMFPLVKRAQSVSLSLQTFSPFLSPSNSGGSVNAVLPARDVVVIQSEKPLAYRFKSKTAKAGRFNHVNHYLILRTTSAFRYHYLFLTVSFFVSYLALSYQT
jgi:hypothetical protein